MTTTSGRARTTLAVGGQRDVPVPDPIARDYLLLALRLEQHSARLLREQLSPPAIAAELAEGREAQGAFRRDPVIGPPSSRYA